jgi:hypothetical protein
MKATCIRSGSIDSRNAGHSDGLPVRGSIHDNLSIPGSSFAGVSFLDESYVDPLGPLEDMQSWPSEATDARCLFPVVMDGGDSSQNEKSEEDDDDDDEDDDDDTERRTNSIKQTK